MSRKKSVLVYVVTLEVVNFSSFSVLGAATTLERAKDLAQEEQLQREPIALSWSRERETLTAGGSGSSQFRVTPTELDQVRHGVRSEEEQMTKDLALACIRKMISGLEARHSGMVHEPDAQPILDRLNEEICALGFAAGSLRSDLTEEIGRLTDEERVELFHKWCVYCGDKNPGCQCRNDE